jgi:protein BCP1
MVKTTEKKEEAEERAAEVAVAKKPESEREEDSSDDSSSDEEDEDLLLEGVIVRNPDVSDSDDTSSSEGEEDEEEEDSKPPPSKKKKSSKEAEQATTTTTKKKKKKKKKAPGPEILQVDFSFCDMDEKYFHGLKTLLTNTSPIFATQSSGLADLMIENISVGTVISTEGDEEGTVFGFASVLNVTTYQEQPSIQALKKVCLDKCPPKHKKELETVLSGKTKRPAGFYLHGRMINLPLEIVEVLHQQLVLDMDWAVEHAEGGDDERKSLDFGAFVRLAPSYRATGVSYYKYFDDEIFAQHAEFTYEMELPKTFGMEETPYCMVVVMTKTGHRAAMKDLGKLVNGDTATAASDSR